MILDAPIAAVTVYDRGATIERRGVVVCDRAAPPSSIVVGELPLALHDATLRIVILDIDWGDESGAAPSPGAPTGLRIHPPEIEVAARGHAPPPDPPDDATQRALHRRVQRLEHRLAQLEYEIELLEDMPLTGPDGVDPTSLPARIAFERYAADAVRARAEAAAAVETELDTAHREVSQADEALARAASARRASPADIVKQIRCRIDWPDSPPRRLELAVRYDVPGARWAPCYRVERHGDDARLVRRAAVAQRTGEDWRGVRLTVCTAHLPQESDLVELVELCALIIGEAGDTAATDAAEIGFRAPPRGARWLFRDYDRDRGRLETIRPDPEPYEGPTSADLHAVDHGAAPLSVPNPVPSSDSKRPQPAPAAPLGIRDLDTAIVRAEPAAGDLSRTRVFAPEQPDTGTWGVDVVRTRLQVGPGLTGTIGVPRLDVPAEHFRLAAPDRDHDRQRLRLVDTAQLRRGALERAGYSVDFDVGDAIRSATHAAASLDESPLPDGMCDVRRAAGRNDFAWRADGPLDVVGDGRFHDITLSAKPTRADGRIIVVPSAEPSAWRRVTLTHTDDTPLLAGPAALYVDSAPIGHAVLPTLAPGDTCELDFGPEPRVRVRTQETRVTGPDASVEICTEVELRSELSRPTRCEIRTRIPVPAADAEVTIEEVEVSPPWQLWGPPRPGAPPGGRLWRIELTNGTSTRLRSRCLLCARAGESIEIGPDVDD